MTPLQSTWISCRYSSGSTIVATGSLSLNRFPFAIFPRWSAAEIPSHRRQVTDSNFNFSTGSRVSRAFEPDLDARLLPVELHFLF
eukprot:m.260404 g.260404  ORF g.260404 m.260404 type:complete len:85 (+) comp40435_c0_seq30:380-634(+)